MAVRARVTKNMFNKDEGKRGGFCLDKCEGMSIIRGGQKGKIMKEKGATEMVVIAREIGWDGFSKEESNTPF